MITMGVTLHITYDPTLHDPPHLWNWEQLIDPAPGEKVKVINTYDLEG